MNFAKPNYKAAYCHKNEPVENQQACVGYLALLADLGAEICDEPDFACPHVRTNTIDDSPQGDEVLSNLVCCTQNTIDLCSSTRHGLHLKTSFLCSCLR